jgi:protein-S-isoprenylcysteine O-methyltransferase Ste14
MSAPVPRSDIQSASNCRWIRKNIIFSLLFLAILFGCAGRINWWPAWAYFGIVTGVIASTYLALRRFSPDLIAERSKLQPGTKTWDKWLAPMITVVGTLSMWVLAGLDARYGWTEPQPAALTLVALTLAASGGLLTLRAMVVNRFFAATVRIQTERGHHVIDSGPYRKIRHPGYTGAALFTLMTPFALGSRTALAPAFFTLVLLVIRTHLEDRTLQRELPGYAEYAERVCYRLVPHIW